MSEKQETNTAATGMGEQVVWLHIDDLAVLGDKSDHRNDAPAFSSPEYVDESCRDGLIPFVRHESALAAQPAPVVTAHLGWKLVPIEPTWDMRNEGRELLIDGIEKEPERLAYFLWKTMVAAAPEVE